MMHLILVMIVCIILIMVIFLFFLDQIPILKHNLYILKSVNFQSRNKSQSLYIMSSEFELWSLYIFFFSHILFYVFFRDVNIEI